MIIYWSKKSLSKLEHEKETKRTTGQQFMNVIPVYGDRKPSQVHEEVYIHKTKVTKGKQYKNDSR